MLPRLLSLALVFLALVSSASAFAAPNDTIESLSEMKEMKTVIEWSRQLRTCDEAADRDIPLTGTSRIIYAIGDNDPKDDRSVAMHSSMGVRNVNLMDSAAVPSEPSDTYNITLQSRPFPISPDSDQKPGTYYHCQGFAANFTQKAHIIRVTPRINYAHSALVHHMLLFKCPTPFSQKDLDWAGNCYSSDTPKPVSACDQISVIAGWAVGGDEFVYPQDVGFPMGEEAGTTFMMLQIHYHNPNHLTFNDSAGFALHMTHQLRQHDAGSFFMQEELSSIRIPAKQSAYEIGVYCPDNCMKFPAAGVNVFASMLHTHETGVAVWTEHFRNGTQLPYIDENRGYDFNYQQVVTFSPDAYPVLKAGDSLKLTCRYNTMQRTGVTTGGIATTDEMCMDYLWYYPAFALDACTGISKATTPGKFTASCNYGKQRTNVLNFTPPNVTVPLPTYPCTAATQGNRTYNGDGTTGTTAISTEQWLADKASFTRSMVLDDQGDFVLYWNVSMDADGHNGVVRFAAEVATSGWFGLGFSASGAMVDADTVIGWVHTVAEGGQQTTVDMTDRYNDKYGRPPIDVSQDIFDVVGVQDMLPVIIPKPNGIYYNFSAGGASGCHHCVPYDESSSSSSTGSVVVLPSSSSSSSIVRGASSSSSVRVVPSSSSVSPSSSRRASSSSSAAMPTSAPQPSSTASAPLVTSSMDATSANTDTSSSAASGASGADSSSGSMDVSSSSAGTSGAGNTTDSSSGADGGSMSNSSLSAGSIAGIVIGSVLGALLMIGLLIFVLITNKNHSSSSSREDVNLIGMTDDSLSNSADRRRNRRNDMRHGLLAGENSTLV